MDTIGLWHIADSGPVRLPSTELQLERDLEDWIERDPSLLERGLVIVGRQLRLDGGPLDLLALDPQGRWVLIEIKRERLRREVVTQAIDYVSCLHRVEPNWLRTKCDAYLRSRNSTHTLDSLLHQRGRSLASMTDSLDVVIYLVGTSVDRGLERMVGFLSEQAELSVRMVTFAVFGSTQGGFTLAREIHERSDVATESSAKSSASRSVWTRLTGLVRGWLGRVSLRDEPGVRSGLREFDQSRRRSPQRPEGPAARESQPKLVAKDSKPALKAEDVLRLADQNGVGEVARNLYRTATDLSLHVRSWGTSIMFAPPSAKSRCLFTVWTERRANEPGVAKVYVQSEVFSQVYGISEGELTEALGVGPLGGWLWLDKSKADRVIAGLRRVLANSGDR
jgi:hypothetical protein